MGNLTGSAGRWNFAPEAGRQWEPAGCFFSGLSNRPKWEPAKMKTQLESGILELRAFFIRQTRIVGQEEIDGSSRRVNLGGYLWTDFVFIDVCHTSFATRDCKSPKRHKKEAKKAGTLRWPWARDRSAPARSHVSLRPRRPPLKLLIRAGRPW